MVRFIALMVLTSVLVAPQAASSFDPVRGATSPAGGGTRGMESTAPLNVRDFGATGDGEHDDTAAFQGAIDGLPLNTANVGVFAPKGFANGGAIFVPRGRYKITSTVRLKRGVRIVGESRESSQIISFTAGSVFRYVDVGAYLPDEIVFENLSIWQDGRVPATSGAAIEVGFPVKAGSPVSFMGSRLLIEGTYTGIALENTIQSSIRDTIISKPISHGVHVRWEPGGKVAPSVGLVLDSVYVLQSRSGAGFRVEQGAYVAFIGCTADANARYGYSIEGGGVIGVYASGAEGNGDSGVFLKDVGNVVLNLWMTTVDSPRYGITLQNAKNVVVTGSRFYSTGGTSGYAIRYLNDANSATVIGTSFFGYYATAVTNATANLAMFADPADPSRENVLASPIRLMSPAGPVFKAGRGPPENVVPGPVGSIYVRTDGGAAATLYVKESGTGRAGWVAK